ncbi:hypothetical protein [Dapis sp. BLCC M172]|uniref:hypothetical protein n=1 Tax=Dapis sp. BLCC M172 TaxID=2975281 RepID=UPI003CEC7FF2
MVLTRFTAPLKNPRDFSPWSVNYWVVQYFGMNPPLQVWLVHGGGFIYSSFYFSRHTANGIRPYMAFAPTWHSPLQSFGYDGVVYRKVIQIT